MFERFTDRARKVMALANQEAINFGHKYIGTEHVLLGLVKEGSGVGANVLKKLDVDLHKVKTELEKMCQPGPGSSAGKNPMTPHTKKLIEYAIEEARNHDHTYVGSEHLLLGLLRVQDGLAAQVLTKFGVTVNAAREEVRDLLGVGIPDSEPPARQNEPVAPPARAESLIINGVDKQLADLTRQKEKAVRQGAYEKAADARDEAIALVRFKELVIKKILDTPVDAAAAGQTWNQHYARMLAQLAAALIESSPELAAKLEGTLEKLRKAAES